MENGSWKTSCDYCNSALEYIKREKGPETFIIYTRLGTQLGQHHEYRWTNRKSCRKGHYYGYRVTNKQTNFDQNCLENESFFTNRQTAFSVMYLYDITLQILFSNASFQALVKMYNALHFTKPTGKSREEIRQNHWCIFPVQSYRDRSKIWSSNFLSSNYWDKPDACHTHSQDLPQGILDMWGSDRTFSYFSI